MKRVNKILGSILIVIIGIIALSTCHIAFSKTIIYMRPLRNFYIVEPNHSFQVGVLTYYETGKNMPITTQFYLFICNFITGNCKTFIKKITLYPNKTELFYINASVKEPSYYIAIGAINQTYQLLSKIICVRDISHDIVWLGPRYLVAFVQYPSRYSRTELISYIEHAIRWYTSHGIHIAPPCLGEPFIFITYYLGKYTLGETVPQFFILRNGTSIGCVWLIAINTSMPKPYIPNLRETVTHELFHAAQTYYMRNSTFLQYWKENWWTIEGGAVAAPYFVWNGTLFPGLAGWSEVWFHYGWYRYDPAWAWYVLYERCMRRCMVREGTWWSCENYCESLSYLSYYVYSPLMWYIFYKEGLNANTMKMIYDSPSPSASLKIMKLLYNAYIDFAKGFPPYPKLKVRPDYMNTTKFSTYLWYRAPLYIYINIPYKGHYRLFINTEKVHKYLYQESKGQITQLKGNDTLITVTRGTVLILVPPLRNMPLQYQIQQYIIPVSIRLVRSLEDCKVILELPPSLVIGKEQTAHLYLINCTSLTGGVIKITDLTPRIVRIVGISIPYTLQRNVFIVSRNSTTIVLGIRFRKVGTNRIMIASLKMIAYGKGKASFSISGKLMSSITGEVITLPGEVQHISASNVLECDFNGNGRLDIGDVVLALKYVVTGIKPPVPCDLNHNGKLDIGDVVLLLRYILGSS